MDQSLSSAVHELASADVLLTTKIVLGATESSIEGFPLCSIYSGRSSPIHHPQSFVSSCYIDTIPRSICLQLYCAILALHIDLIGKAPNICQDAGN